MEGVLGLKRGVVALRPWSPEYPRLFALERARVLSALGDRALDVQHVGSTSVPGLVAKPVLDLAVAVRNAAEMPACVPSLVALGYEAFGDREGRGQFFFALGPDEARTHYLHLMPAHLPAWGHYQRFRDALRSDAALRDGYARLKSELAGVHAHDRREYTARKEAFIRRVLAGAGA